MNILVIKIKYHLSLIAHKLLFKIGFEKKLLKNRYGERIILFHGIDKVGETKYNSRFISKIYFDELMCYFSTNFNVISLDDYYAKKFKKDTLNIAITFDDGYENNYKYAVPILEKYKFTATFFITTIHDECDFLWADFLDLVSSISKKKHIDFLDKTYYKNEKNEFIHNNYTLKNKCKELEYIQIKILFDIFKEEWDYIKKHDFEDHYKLMSKNQINELNQNPLFTIGAHGFYHTNLNDIKIENAFKEIENSKKEVEKICATVCNAFAMPFGIYNTKLIDFCKKIHLNQILLVDYNNNEDKLDEKLKKRFGINPYISKKMQLFFLLKGTYN